MSELFAGVVTALIDVLDRGNSFERTGALRALGVLGTTASAAVPRVLDLLDHPELLSEMAAAIDALAAIGRDDAKVVAKLVDLATRDVASSRGWCVAAFGEMGASAAPAVPLLLNILAGRDTTPEVTPAFAAWALGQIGSDEAFAGLLDAAQSIGEMKVVMMDDGAAKWAVQAIAKLDARLAIKAIPTLASMLRNDKYSHLWNDIRAAVTEIRANHSVF